MPKMKLAGSRPLDAKVKSMAQSNEYAASYERIFGDFPLNNMEECGGNGFHKTYGPKKEKRPEKAFPAPAFSRNLP